MSYQALYRVWRPQTFDELIGQPVITETLKNAISNQQMSHAYLFTGPRGTGKTSAAKIFAKAINCPHQTDGNPCNECEHCRLITQGQLSDVIEIDAASNNGVEEIRNLRENVRYAATSVKYKVYIIDEVHMLTTGAFNALLKTLEEPPENVVFILATTEPHKIPATIISRTQRFDFQRITSVQLIERMTQILEHDGVQFEANALEVIARAANGGMRDSLSLLDQALSFNQKEVTVQSALEISGSLDQIAFVDYLQAIFNHKAEGALEILKAQLQKGKQASRFVEELILFSRDVLLSMSLNKNHTLLNKEEIAPIMAVAPTKFYQLIDALSDVQNKMRFSTQTDLYLEVMTIQLAQEQDSPSAIRTDETPTSSKDWLQLQAQVDALQAQVQALLKNGATDVKVPISTVEQKSSEVSNSKPATPRKRPDKFMSKYQLDIHKVYVVLNEATRTAIEEIKRNWTRILDELNPQERPKFAGIELLAAGPSYALISFADPSMAGLVQEDIQLQRHLYQITQTILGTPTGFIAILQKEWPDTRQQYTFLRKGNQGQPIEIPEDTLSQLKEWQHSLKDRTDEFDNTEVEDLHNMDNILSSMPVENDLEISPHSEIEDEAQLSEEVPEVVSKAIDLFGQENINIYYDR